MSTIELPQVRHKYAEVAVGGGTMRLFYREAGPPGESPLLLLHGFPSASHQFRRLIDGLGVRYHLIDPDYPGFGHTEAPAGFTYSFDALAEVIEGFVERRASHPDWQQQVVELVEDGDTVVARFRCTGTQATAWQGIAPTGRTMDVDEVAFIRITDGRIGRMWALEDNWSRIRQLAGGDVTLGEFGSLS